MQNHDAATPQAREMTLQESVDREHAVLVANLSKPGADIIAQLTPEAAHLWYMASCICGNGPCLAESNGDASQCARREQP